jgi:hypothetical protein
MITKDGCIFLEEKTASTPYHNSINYIDKSNTHINIPYILLFELYDLIEFHMKKQGINFEEFKEEIYAKN